MLKLVLTLLLVLNWSTAGAAGFDCKKAKSKSELMVCADPELSAMDVRLNALVNKAKQRAGDQAAFKRSLVDAWKTRQQCKDAACVKAWYAQRIAELAPEAPGAPVAHVAPVTPVSSVAPIDASIEPKSPAPGGKGRMQTLGRKLGFEIPATRADFLARYSAIGGQCGAGKFRPLKDMYGITTASECWIMAPCPSPSEDFSCGVVRMGYDAKHRTVIFMTQLQPVNVDPKAGAQVLGQLVGVFTALGGKAPAGQAKDGPAAIKALGNEGPLSYQAMVVTPPEGNQFVVVSILER